MVFMVHLVEDAILTEVITPVVLVCAVGAQSNREWSKYQKTKTLVANLCGAAIWIAVHVAIIMKLVTSVNDLKIRIAAM